jgi:hypothetical protein
MQRGSNGWEAWWEKAKPIAEAKWSLSTVAGRQKWATTYLSADQGTRAVLLRLWAFEPAIDETALIRESDGAGGEALKTALSLFWKHGRLSAKAKASLVKKYLRVRLEEVPDQPAARRELRIVGERHFPFPSEAWVNRYVSFAIGDETLQLSDSYSTSSLGEGKDVLTLGTRGGGSYPGKPQARAILELQEVDYHKDRQVIWKHRWDLGPIRLREAKE